MHSTVSVCILTLALIASRFISFGQYLVDQTVIELCLGFQAYGAEAGGDAAEEPMEEAGMTDDIIQKVSNWFVG